MLVNLAALHDKADVLQHRNIIQRILIYPQSFENMAIVLCKTTNEYFQYLFAPWACHIASRAARYLERQCLLERDTGNIYLTPEAVDASDEDPSNQLLGS